MNGLPVGTIVAVSASLFTVIGVAWQVWTGIRARAIQEIRERAEREGKAFADGARSRDDEVRQLTFERDEARRERDLQQRRGDMFEKRYNDARERRGR